MPVDSSISASVVRCLVSVIRSAISLAGFIRQTRTETYASKGRSGFSNPLNPKGAKASITRCLAGSIGTEHSLGGAPKAS